MLTHEQPKSSDRELIIQSQKGNSQAFRQLYQRYQKRVRSTLYQLCGAPLLDDLTQEVFLRVWKGLPKLRQVNTFSTWLYRITWNVAQDRRKAIAKYKQEERLFHPEEEDPFSNLTSPQDTPEILHLHYQDLIKRGLESLSLDHRAVLVLHDLEDVPQKEVAKILNIPNGTVKSRLFHARKSLKTFLEAQGVSL